MDSTTPPAEIGLTLFRLGGGTMLKQFLVDSNLGRCHGHAFVKERLVKISCFFVKSCIFLAEKVFLSAFFSSSSKSAPQN